MLRYLLRRLALTVPVLLGVATMVFALIHLVPGDPAQAMLGGVGGGERFAGLANQLGLDRPSWFSTNTSRRLARGDLGRRSGTTRPSRKNLDAARADHSTRACRHGRGHRDCHSLGVVGALYEARSSIGPR
jgi:hypothetical protein